MDEKLPFDIQLQRKIFFAKIVGLLTNFEDWNYIIIDVFRLIKDLSTILEINFPQELQELFLLEYVKSSFEISIIHSISEKLSLKHLKDHFNSIVDMSLKIEVDKFLSLIEKYNQNDFVSNHIESIKEKITDNSLILKDHLILFISDYIENSKSLIMKVCSKIDTINVSKTTQNNLFVPTSTIDSKSQNIFDDIKTQCDISIKTKMDEDGDFSSSLKFPTNFSSLPVPTLEKNYTLFQSLPHNTIDIITDIPDEIDQLISICPEISPTLFRSQIIPENILDEIFNPDIPNSCIKDFLKTLDKNNENSNFIIEPLSKKNPKKNPISIFDKHDGAEKISWTQEESMLPGNSICHISSIPEDIPFKHVHPPLEKKMKKSNTIDPSSSQRSRIPWTPEEDENLIKGFKEFGKNWAIILNNYSFGPHRTNVSLKDRARILKL